MSEAGKVVFVEVPPGDYTVRVEKPGFQTATSSFRMPEDDHTVNVTLVPAQQPPPQPEPPQPEPAPQPPSQQPPQPEPVPAQPAPTAPSSLLSSPLLKIAAIAAVAVLGVLFLLGGKDEKEEDRERKRY